MSAGRSTWGSRRDASPAPSRRKAVLELLASDEAMAARFVRACGVGATALRELGEPAHAALLDLGCLPHRLGDEREELADTLEALYDLGAELLPDSPGAALGRLRARVAGRGQGTSEVETVEDLAASDHAAFDALVRAAGSGDDGAVLEATRHVYRELYRRGRHWSPGDFSTHVRAVLDELFPEYWAGLCARERRRALLYICSRAADGDLPDLPGEYAEVFAAEAERDHERYRAAVRALVRNAVRMLKREGCLLPEPGAAPAAETERDGDPGSSAA